MRRLYAYVANKYILSFTSWNSKFIYCYNRYLKANVWTHVVFTWNRKTRKGKLYFDGIQVGDTPSSYTGQDIDLNLTNHTMYEIGFKKDTGEVLQGLLRDLAVVLRTLSPGDVSKLYSKFNLLFVYIRFLVLITCTGCFPFPVTRVKW